MVMKSDRSANGLEGYRSSRANTALEWRVCGEIIQKHHHSFLECCGKKGKNAKKSIYLIQVLLNTTTSIDLNIHLKVPFQSETLTQDKSEKRHHILYGVIIVMEPQEEEAQNLRKMTSKTADKKTFQCNLLNLHWLCFEVLYFLD